MAGMAYAAEARIPGILEVNAPLVKEQATYRALVDASGAASAASRAFADATKLVAVSAPLAEWLRTTVRQDDGKVVVLRNGVDLGRFPAPSARRPGAFTVAFVGTLKPWHGLDVLAGAFAALRTDVPDARLLVIGDGPGREGLAGELERLGVSAAVDWKGAVAPETVGTLLASAHATIAPYPAEGDAYFSPLKIVEGMAAGIPVVASAIGQAGELITDGRTGILCTAGDPAAFAAALTGLADAPDRSRRIGAAARAEVAAHHTWDAVAASIVDLMHEGVFA
jgi:glycosyltransferase involved in cell wall biosynthesis